jgi:fumarylacetoacetate (FAA) hydrolase family protein
MTQPTLATRAFVPGEGPCVIRLDGDRAIDVTAVFPTMRDLCERDDPVASLHSVKGRDIGSLADLEANAASPTRDATKPWLLAPVDLQAVKACGVTFAVSMIERVIEEKAKGDPGAATAIRVQIEKLVGNDLRRLKPGSAEAATLKEALIANGAWSQYLEVGIGPDAEVFTKAPVLSAVGSGSEIGVHPKSSWNNPEPEVVLIVNSKGRIVGASLGNDVNLRDVEGRSALLLGKAKDNNASAAIGPYIRFFDQSFMLDHVRKLDVKLTVEGEDGFKLEGGSSIAHISRDLEDLVAQTINRNHQYPDGFALYLGTMFAPIADRDVKGHGFTHKTGDIVTVSADGLGRLRNRVVSTDVAEPWTFGIADLMRNLAKRGLL